MLLYVLDQKEKRQNNIETLLVVVRRPRNQQLEPVL